ncbi:MAG: hypothetical protein ABI852_21850 [Gemmatimonadaceae bacterium]
MRNQLKLIARAVLGAFLPASLTVWGTVLALMVINEPRFVRWSTLELAALEWGLLAGGYAVALLWLPRARFGRALSRRSHALAGVLNPLVLAALSGVVQRPTKAGIAVLSFAAGLSFGVMQWARSRRRVPPRPPTLEALERDADEALARALGEGTYPADVIPIRRTESAPEIPRDAVA